MEEKVTSYNEYLDALDGRGDVIVFRGQPVSTYVLIPSALRPNHRDKADRQMFQFVNEMKKIYGYDELTCLEIAQHFSLPTRMLDFSYSFTVSLFFACFDARGRYMEDDGKVFVFNRSRYEWILKDRDKLSSRVARNNKFLYEWLERYVDKKEETIGGLGIDMPIFVEATRQFDRLYAQRGLFLLWGQDDYAFENILLKEGIRMSDFIDTITIDARAKEHILDELAEKFISEDTMYINSSKIRDLVNGIKYNKKKN